MATLLNLYLLCFPQIDPTIDWHFNSRACEACIDAQLQIMETWYRPTDTIHIYGLPKAWAKDDPTYQKIAKKFKAPKISGDRNLGVGWSFKDPVTGEAIHFQANKGSYNQWRAQEILKLLR